MRLIGNTMPQFWNKVCTIHAINIVVWLMNIVFNVCLLPFSGRNNLLVLCYVGIILCSAAIIYGQYSGWKADQIKKQMDEDLDAYIDSLMSVN